MARITKSRLLLTLLLMGMLPRRSHGNDWVRRGTSIECGAVDTSSLANRPLNFISTSSNGNRIACSGPDKVQVYQWSDDDDSWVQQGGDLEGGFAISLDRTFNNIAIGQIDTSSGIGTIRVYSLIDNTDWEQVGIDIVGPNAAMCGASHVHIDTIGTSLWVFIGCPWTDSDGVPPGFVRVYELPFLSNVWQQRGDIEIGLNGGDAFGFSASFAGNVLIGAPHYTNADETGFAKLYEYSIGPDEWTEVEGGTMPGEAAGGWAGAAVHLLSNTRAAVGAPADGNGKVFLFQSDPPDTNWSKVATFEGESSFNRFGDTVSLSGNALAVGAPRTGTNSYVVVYENTFSHPGNNWVQKGRIIRYTEGVLPLLFGQDVKLADLGNVVAIMELTIDGKVRVHVFEFAASSPTPAPTPCPATVAVTTTWSRFKDGVIGLAWDLFGFGGAREEDKDLMDVGGF